MCSISCKPRHSRYFQVPLLEWIDLRSLFKNNFQSNASRHQLFCKELKYAMVCDNFESTVSVAVPAIPSDIDAENVVDLGQDIFAHLKNFVKVPASGGRSLKVATFTIALLLGLKFVPL